MSSATRRGGQSGVAVIVAMVKVGHMRMLVHQLLVAVPMLMPHQFPIRVGVVMVVVVVDGCDDDIHCV